MRRIIAIALSSLLSTAVLAQPAPGGGGDNPPPPNDGPREGRGGGPGMRDGGGRGEQPAGPRQGGMNPRPRAPAENQLSKLLRPGHNGRHYGEDEAPAEPTQPRARGSAGASASFTLAVSAARFRVPAASVRAHR